MVWSFRPINASAGGIPFFTVAFDVIQYKRRNVFSISSVVVPSSFALSRARLKVSTKRSVWPLDRGGMVVTEYVWCSMNCRSAKISQMWIVIDCLRRMFPAGRAGWIEWLSLSGYLHSAVGKFLAIWNGYQPLPNELRPLIGSAKSTCIWEHGHWSFRLENRCNRWFEHQCSFSLSAASEDWGKTCHQSAL